MAAVTRRQYKGAAASTTITATLTSVATTTTLTATTGWPSTASVPFYVVIDPGNSSEEKCSATISGSTLTLTRGADDTTAVAHSSGATIYPVFSADEADEANNMASTMTTKGDLLVTDGSAFNRLAVGTNGHQLTADSVSTNGVKWALSPETDLVTTKGDLLVATAADTLARQAVGSNGQVLVADSGQTNGVAWVDPQTNRNVVINGAMQVTQRSAVGTAVTSITTEGYYATDRFRTTVSSLGTWSQTTIADAPTGSEFRNSFKMACTTADASPSAGDYLIIQHKLEGQNVQQFLKGTASAKSFALSFWVKSFQTGTFIVELEDIDNSRAVSASYSISVSATWEKKTIIFPADTTGAFDNDNSSSMSLNFWLGAGTTYSSGTLQTTWVANTAANRAVGVTNLAANTNNYWQVTGVQLEAGAVATPFEFEDIGTTLAKCQRYYYRTTAATAAARIGPTGSFQSTTLAYLVAQHPVTMRVTPTAVEFNLLTVYDFNADIAVTNVTIPPNAPSLQACLVGATVASGGTVFRPLHLAANNNTAAYFAISAEL